MLSPTQIIVEALERESLWVKQASSAEMCRSGIRIARLDTHAIIRNESTPCDKAFVCSIQLDGGSSFSKMPCQKLVGCVGMQWLYAVDDATGDMFYKRAESRRMR